MYNLRCYTFNELSGEVIIRCYVLMALCNKAMVHQSCATPCKCKMQNLMAFSSIMWLRYRHLSNFWIHEWVVTFPNPSKFGRVVLPILRCKILVGWPLSLLGLILDPTSKYSLNIMFLLVSRSSLEYNLTSSSKLWFGSLISSSS